jgi:hypothetical protein
VTLAARLAVGGPNLVHGHGWDPAPIVLIGLVLLLMRAAGLRIGSATLAGAVTAGLVIDLLTDATHVSVVLAVAPVVLALAAVALRRSPSG